VNAATDETGHDGSLLSAQFRVHSETQQQETLTRRIFYSSFSRAYLRHRSRNRKIHLQSLSLSLV